MAVIHYLNVNNGDCSLIEHNSEHLSVIDVNNAFIKNIISQEDSFDEINKSERFLEETGIISTERLI